LGGAVVPRGDGSTVIRLRRGASLQDFADKIDANAGQLISVPPWANGYGNSVDR
jgi:translation initiation factor IF-2